MFNKNNNNIGRFNIQLPNLSHISLYALDKEALYLNATYGIIKYSPIQFYIDMFDPVIKHDL